MLAKDIASSLVCIALLVASVVVLATVGVPPPIDLGQDQAVRGVSAPVPSPLSLTTTAQPRSVVDVSGIIRSSTAEAESTDSPEDETPARQDPKAAAALSAETDDPDLASEAALVLGSATSLPSAATLVTRVIDGDTIELATGQRVRYIGIDAPESVHPQKPVQCFGKEATSMNERLVARKQVRLEKDITDTDRYGRLLRYVYVGNTFVNDYLARNGYAAATTYPPDVKYQERLRRAEHEAQQGQKGLWRACQDVGSAPPAQPDTKPSSICTIKGNISAEDEKIYHLPGCESYIKTKIDPARGEQYFCTEQEATSAGWRKAQNCP
jgi:micrococcal nuclease